MGKDARPYDVVDAHSQLMGILGRVGCAKQEDGDEKQRFHSADIKGCKVHEWVGSIELDEEQFQICL